MTIHYFIMCTYIEITNNASQSKPPPIMPIEPLKKSFFFKQPPKMNVFNLVYKETENKKEIIS